MTTLTKQQALKQIDELRAYVEQLDKKKPVEVVGQYEGDEDKVHRFVKNCWQIDNYAIAYKIMGDIGQLGNSFRTREQAKRRLENIETHERLKRLAADAWGGVEIEWTDSTQLKYHIEYNHSDGEFLIDWWVIFQLPNTVYFPTEQSAQSAIDEIGEEAIKQYIEGDLPA